MNALDGQEQGRIIAQMNNSLIKIIDTSYTVRSQSGSWKLEVPMKRSLNIHETKTGIIKTGFAIGFTKGR
jgi:hypothetical protein